MEDRMYGFHGLWELEGTEMWTRFGNDFEGPEELFWEFLWWMGSSEEFSFDVCLTSYGELQSWKMFLVCMDLITLLCNFDINSKLLVEFVEVSSILLGMFRREIAFRVDWDVWMVTFVGEARGNSSGSVWSIVVCKFSKGQKFGPVVLLIIAVDLKVLL
jgi:hypothetical protein